MMRNEERKLDHIISRMQADVSVDAPNDLIKFAKNTFVQRSLQPKPTLFERISAVLRMDLAPGRAAFGERSAGGSTARQMLFEAGSSAIDLRVTANGDMFDIRGQHIGDDVADTVRLEGADAKLTATNDELKGFEFKGVPAGKYSLIITSVNSEIVIDEIVLG